jgi:hypothetical protein
MPAILPAKKNPELRLIQFCEMKEHETARWILCDSRETTGIYSMASLLLLG